MWRDVDRIVLMGDGKILADLHPDELLSTRLLEENGIREPLYLTALRYAGVELAPAKKPAHVDSVVIDKADRKKMTDWFWSARQQRLRKNMSRCLKLEILPLVMREAGRPYVMFLLQSKRVKWSAL